MSLITLSLLIFLPLSLLANDKLFLIKDDNTYPEVRQYFAAQFSEDVAKAVEIGAVAAHPFNLKLPINIHVFDSSAEDKIMNGHWSLNVIDLQIGAEEGDRIERIKSVFWHEYGHEVYDHFLRTTEAGRENDFLLEVLLKAAESREGAIRIYGHAAVNKADSRYGSNLMNLLGYYNELMADVFRILVKKDSDDNDLRNFRKLDLENMKSGHAKLNPTRDYLWRNDLAKTLNSPEKLNVIWKNLVNATLMEIDARYDKYFKTGTLLSDPKSFYHEINEKLIERYNDIKSEK